MDRPLSTNRVTRFHAARFAHAALLCLGLFWLASRASSQAVALAGIVKTMVVVPALLSVSAQLCPETDSGTHVRAVRTLGASLACSLLIQRT